jgi:hypothetical protein
LLRAFLAFCTIAGTILALVVFWPRVTISMMSDPRPLAWLYVVKNDSFFSLSDLTGTGQVLRIDVGREGGRVSASNDPADYTEDVPVLHSEDEHTFHFPVFTFDPPAAERGGRVEIHVDYRYMKLFRRSVAACFELVATAGSTSLRWLRQACQ